jgi:CBS domain-containing protein
MQVREVMTPDPAAVAPGDTLQRTAQLMDELNVGVLPVVEDGRLRGVLTDRDIVVRSTSAGQDPKQARISDAMTDEVRSLPETADVEEAAKLMESVQIRRLPITAEDGRLTGIVSLGDLATAGTPEAETALEEISTPSEPDR